MEKVENLHFFYVFFQERFSHLWNTENISSCLDRGNFFMQKLFSPDFFLEFRILNLLLL
ncbi:hypothetical protein LEP1GSC175_2183 [Leptospira santarosai str. HAI821]|nr:hypothetical protein LEP1GSC175_2183 [Leptospira santarosai str. HAI821]